MERQVKLSDISDGKLYGQNDMVKADCNDCEGCSACCTGMGTSIVLDPLDIYHLMLGLNCTFEALLKDKIELNVPEGIILPNLKMSGQEEKCAFLDGEGRCSVHKWRPGICRIFPLGRYYENDSFQYFLQVNECRKDNRTKIKVKKWIDTADIKNNEIFINEWHYFIKETVNNISACDDDTQIKNINIYILNQFFIKSYDMDRDFYVQFHERLAQAKEHIGVDCAI